MCKGPEARETGFTLRTTGAGPGWSRGTWVSVPDRPPESGQDRAP